MRGICRQAGVTARYFYESFADKDDFVAAVFDWVIADIAATRRPRLPRRRADEQNRAAMANIVRTIADDPRVGRLLFNSQLANPVLVRKREEARRPVRDAVRPACRQRLRRAAERARARPSRTSSSAVSAVTISAWLAGQSWT